MTMFQSVRYAVTIKDREGNSEPFFFDAQEEALANYEFYSTRMGIVAAQLHEITVTEEWETIRSTG